MPKLVPTAEEIRALAPEEKESLKKDYFRKIKEDYPGLDYLMINSAIDEFLAEPEMTPDDILKYYNPGIWEKNEDKIKEVEAKMETLPDEGKRVKNPMALELMEESRKRAPENQEKQEQQEQQQQVAPAPPSPNTSQ